ncbi:ATP-binding protein [Chloroflexota bacterium]
MIYNNSFQQGITALKTKMADAMRRRGHQHPPLGPAAKPGGDEPVCPKCLGHGVLRRDLPVGDPEFGILVDCSCQLHKHSKKIGKSGLYGREENTLRWEDLLHVNCVDKALPQIQAAIRRGHGWIYLWGTYGTAKTLLLKTAVAEWSRDKRPGRYCRMVDLLDDLRRAYDQDNSNQALVERVAAYTNLPLLALDEIDRHKATDWAQERVFQLLDRRYASAELDFNLTLIASNKPPEELDGYLASRVNDGRFIVIHLDGVDIRPGLGEE